MKPRKALAEHPKTYLLIKVNKYVVRQLERFNSQQDRVPVTLVYICNKAFDAFHCVEGDGGFLL